MRTDILLDDDFDLQITNGDFDTGKSDQQHVQLLSFFNKGELRQFPIVGFGVERYLKTVSDKKKFTREMKIELENDGYMDATVQIGDDIKDFTVILNE